MGKYISFKTPEIHEVSAITEEQADECTIQSTAEADC